MATPVEPTTSPVASMRPAPNLGVLNDVPIPARLIAPIRFLIGGYVRLSGWLRVALALAIIWIVTLPARQTDRGFWFNLGLTVLLVFVAWVLGAMLIPTRNWVLQHVLGKPAFGDAGGLPERVLRATFRAAPDVRMRFGAEDEAILKRLAAFDVKLAPIRLRHTFMSNRMKLHADADEAEAEWGIAWDAIKHGSIENTTYADLTREHPYAFNFIPPTIFVALATTVDLDFFLVSATWMSYRWETHSASALELL